MEQSYNEFWDTQPDGAQTALWFDTIEEREIFATCALLIESRTLCSKSEGAWFYSPAPRSWEIAQ